MNGFSDSLMKAMTCLLERMKSLAPFGKLDTYSSAFEVLDIEIEKFFTQEPHEIGGELLTELIYKNGFDPKERKEGMKRLT